MSGANARTDILESEMKRDPAFALAVSSLERCLKVRERVGSSLISGRPGKPSGSGGIDTAVRETDFKGSVSDAAPVEVLRRSGAVGGTAFRPISAGHGSACAVERALGKSSKLSSFENDGGLVDGVEGDVCSSLGRRGHSGAETVLAIAVEDERINGLLEGSESDFSKNLADESADSPGRVRSSAAHATAGESKGIVGSFQPSESEFPSLNSSLGSLSSACTRHVACRVAAAAAARVCPGSSSLAVSAAVARAHASTLHDSCSTSWSDTVRVTGSTGTRRVKGGVSGPAEDLRPVSEVEGGVNFRPAGSVRGQVPGSLPWRQRGTGTRQVKGSVVTPPLHPEVPGIQFVSPGYGLDIRQSMGWTKVCGTAQSGIWVLKGIARACMFPPPSGGMDEAGYLQDCLGYARARLSVFIQIWTGSFIRWHSDNEPLFGPQNLPKLIVSWSLGNSVEFMVRRRASRNFPSSIRLDHGDVLVMDGLAQSEYEHCTAS